MIGVLNFRLEVRKHLRILAMISVEIFPGQEPNGIIMKNKFILIRTRKEFIRSLEDGVTGNLVIFLMGCLPLRKK